MVTELRWQDGGTEVYWLDDGRICRRFFAEGVRSAVVLKDGSGVAVVPQAPRGVLDAAVIVNSDGTDRLRITAPSPHPESTYLDQMYYVGDELTIFQNVRGYDWAHVIDERTGAVLRSYESR